MRTYRFSRTLETTRRTNITPSTGLRGTEAGQGLHTQYWGSRSGNHVCLSVNAHTLQGLPRVGQAKQGYNRFFYWVAYVRMRKLVSKDKHKVKTLGCRSHRKCVLQARSRGSQFRDQRRLQGARTRFNSRNLVFCVTVPSKIGSWLHPSMQAHIKRWHNAFCVDSIRRLRNPYPYNFILLCRDAVRFNPHDRWQHPCPGVLRGSSGP
jgi:hypothetical protein